MKIKSGTTQKKWDGVPNSQDRDKKAGFSGKRKWQEENKRDYKVDAAWSFKINDKQGEGKKLEGL